ncbi:MAG TPA: hypothetical protein VFE12_05175 [Acetobacteraceae bacterium]|nr:hypothetical protein [Acetobacteraceae bacterium]
MRPGATVHEQQNGQITLAGLKRQIDIHPLTRIGPVWNIGQDPDLRRRIGRPPQAFLGVSFGGWTHPGRLGSHGVRHPFLIDA